MTDDQSKIELASLKEKLISTIDKADAAHRRLDRMEVLIREDFASMAADLKGLLRKVDTVVAWMNRSKGWAKAGVTMLSILSAVAGAIISWLLNRGG